MAREHACARLILDLARYTDSGDYAAALALFSDDAVMDRDGEIFSGIAALRLAYAQRPAPRITRHVLSNIVVQLEGVDRARASSYVTVYRHMREPGQGDPPYRMPGADVLGEYQDRLVHTAAGWRLVSRITRTVFQFRDSKKG
ncbi:MAG: nuclear transport factor 2 family protein [Rhodoferax sp.]|nr:nuclear transport factor 2 family protein [Rhodoferax sp.]